MIGYIAVAGSVALFVIAAVAMVFKGHYPVAALYGCFALTNCASLWIATSTT